ncbi:MAG: excinuclease ATPase subunit [Parasporobacterium sp.]|nr:excinuclease ATPase subunit [Parasporobacterium sp.]
MTWGSQFMYYICPDCGKKFRYAIELIPEFGDEFGCCPVCGKMGELVGEGPIMAQYQDHEEVE